MTISSRRGDLHRRANLETIQKGSNHKVHLTHRSPSIVTQEPLAVLVVRLGLCFSDTMIHLVIGHQAVFRERPSSFWGGLASIPIA